MPKSPCPLIPRYQKVDGEYLGLQAVTCLRSPSGTFKASLALPPPYFYGFVWVCWASVLLLGDRSRSHPKKVRSPSPARKPWHPAVLEKRVLGPPCGPSLLSLGFSASFPYWAGMPSLPTGFPPYKGPEDCHSRPILSPIYLYNFCGLTELRSAPLFPCLFGFVG